MLSPAGGIRKPSVRRLRFCSKTATGKTGQKLYRGRRGRQRGRGEARYPAAARARDLAGVLKYNFPDARYILERASARETTSRVAVGGFAKLFLAEFGISILSHVIAVGDVALERDPSWEEIEALAEKDEILLNCADPETEQRMKAVVDEAYKTGDTRGGVFEVVAHNLPVGLGSHVTWDTKLDGRLAQAVLSMQAVKGIEIGRAVGGGESWLEGPGHDSLR